MSVPPRSWTFIEYYNTTNQLFYSLYLFFIASLAVVLDPTHHVQGQHSSLDGHWRICPISNLAHVWHTSTIFNVDLIQLLL